MFRFTLSYARYVLSALSSVAFGLSNNLAPRLVHLQRVQIPPEREQLMFRLTLSYVRYALSALTAVAFGVYLN